MMLKWHQSTMCVTAGKSGRLMALSFKLKSVNDMKNAAFLESSRIRDTIWIWSFLLVPNYFQISL